MINRLRYLAFAVANMRGPRARVPMLILPVLLAGWVVGVFIIPGPRDPLANYLSWTAAVGGVLTFPGQFLALRQKYPPLVLLGGGLCILIGIFCFWREPSTGLLIRVSLPLLLTGLIWYYCFYFSMFRGKHLISRLQGGDRFPTFALPDTQNKPVALPGLLARGPVLMLFYKGDW